MIVASAAEAGAGTVVRLLPAIGCRFSSHASSFSDSDCRMLCVFIFSKFSKTMNFDCERCPPPGCGNSWPGIGYVPPPERHGIFLGGSAFILGI